MTTVTTDRVGKGPLRMAQVTIRAVGHALAMRVVWNAVLEYSPDNYFSEDMYRMITMAMNAQAATLGLEIALYDFVKLALVCEHLQEIAAIPPM